MQEARLEVSFANLYAEALTKTALSSETKTLAFRIGLLSDRYESVALSHTPETAEDAFLHGIATGNITLLPPPTSRAALVKQAVLSPDELLSPTHAQILSEGRLGEAMLLAISLMAEGAEGDQIAMGAGLAILNKLGLTDISRRATLQWLILPRRG